MGANSKGAGQTIGFRYYMSIHMGLCRGPIDELVQIDVGGLRAWPVPDSSLAGGWQGLMTIAEGPSGVGIQQFENGSSSPVDGGLINTIRWAGAYLIKASRLFGGDTKEGGIEGNLSFLAGNPTQVVPGWITTLMGGRVPGFRGVSTLFFDGLITSMNPYPKKWEFRVRRTLSGWDGDPWHPELATIWMRDGTIKAMNGAHILYECLTNRDWARGLSRDLLTESAWLSVATTLFNENFGLCLRYTRQSDLSSFIQDVLDHIGGTLYPDRSTGLLSLGLLRGSYDPNTIPLFTYDSGLLSLDDSETASQDDLVNEVVVKWTNPITKEMERQARVSNIAGVQSAGAPNSTTRTYAGAATVDLALRLAQRDLKAGVNALKRYKVVLDRRAWKIVTGSLLRVSVPERNIFNIILRAGKITESGDENGQITVEAVIDVFGMPSASFIASQNSEWAAPDRSAQIATTKLVREATYAELVRTIDPANLALVSPTTGTLATMAGKPTTSSLGYSLLTRASGETEYSSGSGGFAPYVVSDAVLLAYETVLSFTASNDLGLAAIGNLVQLGDEMCRLDDIFVNTDGSGTITIARGCIDTIPKRHDAGTIAFLISNQLGTDSREYESGEMVEVKILPYTSSNLLSSDLAPVETLDVIGRQGRPYPPADVRVNGTPFALATSASGTIELTWVSRNRLLQQDQLVEHTAAAVVAEEGTTYTVRVYDGDTSDLLRTAAGITTDTYEYDSFMAVADGAGPEVWFEIESERDGLASFNKYRFGVIF